MSVTGMWISSEQPELTSFFSAPEASLSQRQYHTRRNRRHIAQTLDLLQVGLDLGL